MQKKKTIIIGIVLALIVGGILLVSNNLKKPEKNESIPNIQELPLVTKILSSLELSLGDKRPMLEDFILDADLEGELKIYFDDLLYEEDTLNKIGKYKVEIIIDNEIYTSEIEVLDKEEPILKLKNVSIKRGENYKLDSFIESCSDNSGEDCLLAFTKEEMSKYTNVGTYDIEISAKDLLNNEIIETTKLTIIENTINQADNIQNSSNEIIDNNASDDIVTEATKNASIYTNQVNEVLKYTNEIRTKLGLSSLTLSSSLTKAAMIRAIEISTKFSHTRPNNESYASIFKELNITASYNGENIAAGRSSAETTVDDWEASPGHYANMINTNYTKMGVGYVYIPGTEYKYYWVQLFSN